MKKTAMAGGLAHASAHPWFYLFDGGIDVVLKTWGYPPHPRATDRHLTQAFCLATLKQSYNVPQQSQQKQGLSVLKNYNKIGKKRDFIKIFYNV